MINTAHQCTTDWVFITSDTIADVLEERDWTIV